MNRRRWTLWIALIAICGAGPGCASIKRLTSSTDDIAVKHEQRTAEAVQAFESQRDLAQLQAARARWREGNLEGCRTNLEQLLTRNPQYIEGRVLLVELLLSQERYDAAIQNIDQALAQQPNDPRLHHLRGLVLEAEGHLDESLEAYKKAAELEPENEQYAMSTQAAADGFAEQPASYATDSTRSATGGAADARPTDLTNETPQVREALTEAERALAAKDANAAKVALENAISLESDSPRLPIRAAVLALRHGHPELAAQVLQPAAVRFPDSAGIHRTLGTAYYRQGQYTQAQQALNRALSLDKSNALAYLLMGCTLEKLGQSTAAKAQFDHAHRLDPRL